MGYLSQKKHELRKNIFLHVMTVLMLILTAGAFANPGFHFGFFNLFHLYCLSIVIFVYALWMKKFKQALLFGLVLLVNYTLLASAANIFLSDRFRGTHDLSLTFNTQEVFTKSFAREDILSAGSLVLAGKYIVPFVILKTPSPITLVRIDFLKAPKREYGLIFNHLQEFILRQDNPVIIFGDFGIPSWNRIFKNFLQSSELTVKNKLLFTGNNFLKPSDFYVLGFREMGISKIKAAGKGNGIIVDMDISFNPARL